jgi:hypothetical protein
VPLTPVIVIGPVAVSGKSVSGLAPPLIVLTNVRVAVVMGAGHVGPEIEPPTV